MIPLEIRLNNFLSYREQVTVDLRAIHLACISGPNGAGKSTLLDAMTWALFGQSRVRSDDDLVHTSPAGREGAEVELIFDMEGVLYRVQRRKRRGKSIQLEFQVGAGDGSDTHWQSLTEARVKETEAAIERVLRMNYDLFVNASFFLQGKADAFTSRTPGQRKEILAEVLGVTRWDVYGKRVAAERKRNEAEVELLRRRLEDVAAELAEAEERQQRLAEAMAAEAAIRERLGEKEQFLQQARQVESLIAQQQQQVSARTAELTTIERERDRLQQRIDERNRELAQYESIVADAQQIEADFAAWSVADAAYQRWQAVAEQVHQLETQQSPLQVRIAAARSRLEQLQQGLEARRQVIEADQAERTGLQARLEASQKQLADLAEQSRRLAAKESELREWELEFERHSGERKQREQELQRLTSEFERVGAARAERIQVATVLGQIEMRRDDLVTKLQAMAQLGEQVAGWTAERDQLATQRAQLAEEGDNEKARIAQLSADTGAECPMCGQPLTAGHRATVVAQLEADLAQKRNTYRLARERETSLEAKLKEQADLAGQRARLQRDLDTQLAQLTSGGGRLQTVDQLVSQWTESGAADQLAALQTWAASQAPGTEQTAVIAALRAEVSRKGELDRQLNTLQQQITRTESRLEQIEHAAAEWATNGRPALESVTGQLLAETFAEEERRQLAGLQQQLDALAYAADQHRAAQQTRQALAAAPERQQLLRQAQAALNPISEALDESKRQLAERLAQHAAVQVQQETSLAALHALREAAVDSAALESEVIRLREEQSRAGQTVGATKQKVAVLDDRRRQKKEFEQAQNTLDRRIQQLKLLEEACGRNGVQALLIDHALPEIEERANELLDRLSGGVMRVRFDTQRELKSRDALAETLDIHIGDSAGERPYENFSGGEQFRVNFAVRLALSQVLAHRAGARLRTLVIDEGFGSQDPEGRQRLVEAINAVQSDFECILVITHIDELRDAFPSRIEVSKTGAGSRVNVVAGL